MEFNSLVYPAPTSKGTLDIFMASQSMRQLMLLVDQKDQYGKVEYQIPCMFYDKRGRSFFNYESVDVKKSDRLIMYFHGNAEDVADNMYFFKQL